MTCRNLIAACAVVLFFAARAVCAQTPQAQTPTIPAVPAYRIIQVVSTNMAEQKINEAAAEGYRVLAFQPTTLRSHHPLLLSNTSVQSGVTILLHKATASERYQYRLVWAQNANQFKKSLNDCGAQGLRVVPSSFHVAWTEQHGLELILWPSYRSKQDKLRYDVPIALFERPDGGTSKFSYDVITRKNHLDAAVGAGYLPVAGDFLRRFMIVEREVSTSATERARSGQFQYARLATFRAKASGASAIHADIRIDSSMSAAAAVIRPTKDATDDAPVPPGSEFTFDSSQIAGRRVILLTDGLTSFMETPVFEILTETGAPDTPAAYEILLRPNFAELQKAIEERAGRGNRLFSQVCVSAKRVSRLKGTRELGIFPSLDVQNSMEMLAVMAVMYPTPKTRYTYRMLHFNNLADALKQLNEADEEDFHFVLMDEDIAIVEREQRSDSAAGASR